MKILTVPNPQLSKSTSLVEDIEKEVLPFLKEMKKLMSSSGGVALAAPQVDLNSSFFIDKGEVYINPILTILDETLIEGREGCLSLPGGIYLMKRHKSVRLDYTNLKGNTVSTTATIPNRITNPKDQLALVKCLTFQHEMNHLEGKTLADLGKPFLGQFGKTDEEKERRVDPRTLPIMDLRTLQHFIAKNKGL